MLEYGMKVVAGVTPGRGGEQVHGVPVFDTVQEALDQHPVDATMILVPPPFVLEAASEAIENGIGLVVIITEHVPVLDSIQIQALAKARGSRVIGPNTIGVISPGQGKVGIMPGYIYKEGNIGIISRSGTLTHEVASNLTFRGIGQSTCIGIGGDPVIGTTFVDALELFRNDDQTQAVIMIGEIGGSGEEIAAEHLKEFGYPKPVYAFIAGATAPPEKRMGHAGAIVERGTGTAESKIRLLSEAGVIVAKTLDQLIELARSRQ
jgi:succinyl-CoA synthetase alpha subunit